MYVLLEAFDTDPIVPVCVSLGAATNASGDFPPAKGAMLVIPTLGDDIRPGVTGARFAQDACSVDKLFDGGTLLKGFPVPRPASIVSQGELSLSPPTCDWMIHEV